MKNKNSAKLYIILTICTAFIFSFSYFGSEVYGNFTMSKDVYTEGTAVGPIDVAGLTAVEARAKLEDRLKNWQDNTTIILQYKEMETKLDLNIIKFDSERSFYSLQQGAMSPLDVQLNGEALKDSLRLIAPELTAGNFDIASLENNLIAIASLLESQEHVLKLQEYSTEITQSEIVTQATISVKELGESIEQWTNSVPEIEVLPHSQFSLLKYVEDNGLTSSFKTESLSAVASAIYKAVLASNFSISERHISRMLPMYAEAGFEAKVDPNKNMDFIIVNPNDDAYLLQFKYADNLLNVSVVGSPFLYTYEIVLKDKETFKPKKVVQYDAKLKFGEEKIQTAGLDGLIIKVYRSIKGPFGSREELIAEDFYMPVHQVVIRSLTAKIQNDLNDDTDEVKMPADQAEKPAEDEEDKASDDKQNEQKEVTEKNTEEELTENPDDIVK